MRKKEKQKNVTNSFIVGIIGCFIFIGAIIVYTKDVVVLKEEVSFEEEINLGDTCGYTFENKGNSGVGTSSCSSAPNKCRSSLPNASKAGEEWFLSCYVSNGSASGCQWRGTKYVSVKTCTACDAGKNLVKGECVACSVDSITQPKAVSSGNSSFIELKSNCNKMNVSCTNAECPSSITRNNFYAKIGEKCQDVKITVSAGTSSKSITIPKSQVRTTWSWYCSDCSIGNNITVGKDNADKNGKDVYGSGCEKLYGVMFCDNIYVRSGCAKPEIKSYDYCCVKDDNTEASWKSKQTSKSCASGWHIDNNITTPTKCNNPACYKRTNGRIAGELVWTMDSTIGTKTNISKSNCRSCYINAATLADATDAIYTTSDKVGAGFTHVVDVSETKCEIVPKVTFCDFKDYHEYHSTLNTKNTEKCEDNVEIKFNDGKKCAINKDAYYKIECDNKYTFSYDNDNDIDYDNPVKTTNTVIPGEGFGFGITVLATRTCTGTFDANKWKEDYKTLSDGLKVLKDQSDIELVKNQMQDLKDFVIEYNDYNNNALRDSTAKFTVEYETLNNKKEKLSTDFIVLDLEKGEGKYISKTTHDLGVSGVKNPINYTWSNESTPKAYKLIFPFVYLDSVTGEVTNDKEGVEGGYRLFVSTNAKEQTKKMTVNTFINGITSNNNPTISNKECELKIIKPEYKYRPIDVANPFINSSYKKGANWLNSMFDFTRVIQKDIWTKKPLYVVTLSPTDIDNIQQNNEYYLKAGKAPYYGLCKALTASEINKDSVVKKICDALNIKY